MLGECVIFINLPILKSYFGTSLVVQRLRRCASNAGGEGSILGRGAKIPRAARCGQKQSYFET